MSDQDTDRPSHILRLADLPARKRTGFALAPDAAGCAALAGVLGIEALRKVRFEGALVPVGKADWRLEATLGATVVQPCVVTLAPVTTRIEEEVTRRYMARFEYPEAAEAEMPEEVEAEPLPAVLDLYDVLEEALSLALPSYPRADGAETGEAVFTEPGKEALRDADLKPFAGLASLRDKLTGSDEEDG